MTESFGGHSRQDMAVYQEAALKYRPDHVKILFLCESPPFAKTAEKRSYFFFETCPGTDILFATIVKAIYDIDYLKASGQERELLGRMQEGGFWLMDAVEAPINRDGTGRIGPSQRRTAILSEMPDLFHRLEALRESGALGQDTGIILIKKIVFELLAKPLSEAGYRVLNRGKIDFPKYYRDRDTISGIRGC